MSSAGVLLGLAVAVAARRHGFGADAASFLQTTRVNRHMNPSGCFSSSHSLELPEDGTWTVGDARSYMSERRALKWEMTGTAMDRDFNIAYCPDTDGALERTEARLLDEKVWPAREADALLDEALQGLEKDGRPLIWMAFVGSDGTFVDMTMNFMCNLQQESLLNRTLVLVEDSAQAARIREAFPEARLLSDAGLLAALRRTVEGGHFDPTGYRLMMHRLLLQRGYPVLHMDADIHISNGQLMVDELQRAVEGHDLVGMRDVCELEMNGGFQLWMPTNGSLRALATAIGMQKPMQDGYVLSTANDQWALNCGLLAVAAHGELRAKVLPRSRFHFEVDKVKAEDIGVAPRKMLVLHTGSSNNGHEPWLWKELGLWRLAESNDAAATPTCVAAP